MCFYDDADARVPDKSEPWLALVQRGNCSFIDKVREAMALGARGVIVGGGPANDDGLVTMYNPGARMETSD